MNSGKMSNEPYDQVDPSGPGHSPSRGIGALKVNVTPDLTTDPFGERSSARIQISCQHSVVPRYWETESADICMPSFYQMLFHTFRNLFIVSYLAVLSN